VSLLDHLLLGLLLSGPKSGYDLRRLLQDSELGQFSDSPGSVYPALRRLEKSGQVRAAAAKTRGARRRTLYKLSARGRKALASWIRERQTDESLRRCPQEFSVKYAFAQALMTAPEIVGALDHQHELLQRQIRGLRARIDALPAAVPLTVREVLDLGVVQYRAHQRWVRSVRARHSQEK
jgi:DNA-binding PadR family transcriptional regulator